MTRRLCSFKRMNSQHHSPATETMIEAYGMLHHRTTQASWGKLMNRMAIKEVLLALQDDGIKLGPAWDRAHDLAQTHEGDLAHDRLHAFLHRVEGDSFNAAYWYRRSGEPVFEDDLKSECTLLIERCR